MIRSASRTLFTLSSFAALAACGGSAPPPKTEEPAREPSRERTGGGPAVEQELGSIDQGAVEKKFQDLRAKLEACHTKGRGRVDYLAGDVKAFLRIGKDGRVRYGWLEESTLGDRDTEKCILDVFGAADWPKPQGGEAEVRNGFGWPGGDERPPVSWGPEKVIGALDEARDVKKAVHKCKAGVSGDFRVTAYVEPGDADDTHDHGAKPASAGPKKGGKKHDKAEAKRGKGENRGGKFKAIGVAPPGKDAADKADCIVDALRDLSLPSPGSYAAKVTFAL
jgi:hypothetical protein